MTEARIRYARTTDGVDIAYGVVGSGPPLLVVRAVMGLAVDDELAPESDASFLALAGTHRVVVWDPRGFGLSTGSEPKYTLGSSVAEVEAVADALKLDRFDLLGHLSPSHTALSYAARHPGRVRRLAVWNPSAPGTSMRAGSLLGLPEIAHSHFYEYVQLAALRNFGWERGGAAKRWVDHASRQFTAESWDRVMTELERLDATAELPAVSSPTLVIDDVSQMVGGSRTEESRRYAKQIVSLAPDAELVTLKRGTKQTYAEVIGAFFAAHDERAVPPPSGTAIIMFADIVDSTALTERLGDAAFRERSSKLDAAMRRAITEAGGSAVDGKLLGDGVMAVFGAAREAIAAALQCNAAAAEFGLELHLGIHAGDVIREDNNVYGGAVNIASRICGLSAPGEILVSDVVRGMARSSAGVEFEDRGEQEMKGVGEPVRVYAVRWQDGDTGGAE